MTVLLWHSITGIAKKCISCVCLFLLIVTHTFRELPTRQNIGTAGRRQGHFNVPSDVTSHSLRDSPPQKKNRDCPENP